MIPWALRGQLLIPPSKSPVSPPRCGCYAAGAWTLSAARSGGRKWGLHILLPLIPNLLVALTLMPMLGKRRGYLMLYMPDYAWIAMVCGSFSLVWSFLRTGLVLWTLREPSSPWMSLWLTGLRRRGLHVD